MQRSVGQLTMRGMGRPCTSQSFSALGRTRSSADSLDTEVSSMEDGLECPVCWEVFNDTDNLPYVLWCGHTLCKNCVIGLQCAVVKCLVVPVQLPLFIACPWCQFLSLRFFWKGNLKCPCKNYFLLYMVESSGGASAKHSRKGTNTDQRGSRGGNGVISEEVAPAPQDISRRYEHADLIRLYSGRQVSSFNHTNMLRQGSDMFFLRRWFYTLLAFCVQVTAKLTLLFLLLFILFYILPFSTVILVMYVMATLIFAFPSLLMVYFAFPSLSWLVREIVT